MLPRALAVKPVVAELLKLTFSQLRDLPNYAPPQDCHPHPPLRATVTMPKFFCDYCDVYLTHDSMSVRKAHNSGRNHLRNVQAYYEQISSDQTQQVINS